MMTLDEAWSAFEDAAPTGATLMLVRRGVAFGEPAYRAEAQFLRDEHMVFRGGPDAPTPLDALRLAADGLAAERA